MHRYKKIIYLLFLRKMKTEDITRIEKVLNRIAKTLSGIGFVLFFILFLLWLYLPEIAYG